MSSGRPMRCRLTRAAAAVPVLAALVTAVPLATPAAAAGEVVNFELPSSTTPEGSSPVINVELTNTEANEDAVVVTVIATPGTASPGDYNLSPAAIVFPPDSLSGTKIPVDLTFVPDNIYENGETLTLTITSTSIGIIGPNSDHTATIINDDEEPTLTIADVTKGEGDGPIVFTATRSGLTEVTATAVATPKSGTAARDDDFDSAAGAISIPPGGTTNSDTFAVALVSDDVYEPNETFTVELSGLFAAQAGDLTATGTILDDDTPPTLSINDVTVGESAGSATFTVTRTGRTAFDTDIDVATADATATAGFDYTAQSTTLTLLSGGPAATGTIVVPIADDGIDEDTESYAVTLANPTHATILDATGTGTILDDDTAGFALDLGDGVFVVEGDAPDSFEFGIESEPTAPITVTFNAAADQLEINPTVLVFDATNWETSRTVTVTALEDGVDEVDPHTSAITISTSSGDSDYHAANLPAILATIGDADALLVTIDGPEVGAVGRTSTFNAMVNAGGTGTIIYEWKVFSQSGPLVAEGDQATFGFTPTTGGGYFIQVIVGDSQGQNPAKFIEFRALADLSGSVFGEDIVWLANAGITKGCNPPENDEFCPTDPVTREQMAAFLVRFLGLRDDGGGNTFTDDNGSIFEADIAKLAAAGITKGCNPPTNDRFCPKSPVTREQMAAFLVRALGLTDDGGGNTFVDDNGSIFEADIAKLAAAGITKGCNPPTNDRFCPTAVVTREQMAGFLRRADRIE